MTQSERPGRGNKANAALPLPQSLLSCCCGCCCCRRVQLVKQRKKELKAKHECIHYSLCICRINIVIFCCCCICCWETLEMHFHNFHLLQNKKNNVTHANTHAAAAAAALFTVNLLRSLTHTHNAHALLHSRSLLLTLSLSLAAAAAAQPARAQKKPKPSEFIFFVFFSFFASSLLRFVCSALPLSLSLIFLFVTPGNAPAAAMQLVGVDAGSAVTVVHCFCLRA